MTKDSERFLRDPELRAILYRNANGLCQKCNNPLPDYWHADHVIPWSVSPRTNVFEMQLCARPATYVRETRPCIDYPFLNLTGISFG